MDAEQQELSFTDGENAKGSATLEDSWQLLTKLNILLPHNPAVMLLEVYSTYFKTYSQNPCRLQVFDLHERSLEITTLS